jgi:tetratricopeptide (TPR) repeat protein
VVFDTSDPVTNVAVGERLKARSDALFWLTIGLTHQLLGRSEDALQTFLRAEQELVDWRDSDGKEILYFFTGREQFFLSQIDEAEESFRRALRIDPNYGRAQLALGSIYQQRAEDVAPQERLEEPRYVELAVDHHRKGLDLALATEDPLLEAVARVALAKSYRLLGETYDFLDDLEEAHRLYDLVIAEVDKATMLLGDTVQYRILAQAFETQGAAYLQQGLALSSQQQTEESRVSLEMARTAYQHCIDQGGKAPFDEILQESVIGQNCRRLYDRTVEFLQGLEEG